MGIWNFIQKKRSKKKMTIDNQLFWIVKSNKVKPGVVATQTDVVTENKDDVVTETKNDVVNETKDDDILPLSFMDQVVNDLSLPYEIENDTMSQEIDNMVDDVKDVIH